MRTAAGKLYKVLPRTSGRLKTINNDKAVPVKLRTKQSE